MTTASHNPVAARRFTRRAATGCLLLLMVPAALLAYFWYSVWHTGHVNVQREEAAMASILAEAQRASQSTTRALNSAHTGAPDALTNVIWRHTQAPVIAYDPTHRTYTAIASWSTIYTQKALLSGGGATEVERCFTLISAQALNATWATKLTESSDDMCSSGRMIASEVALAKNRIKNMTTQKMTQADVAQALDPTHEQRIYTVKKVTRSDDVVVISVLVRHQRNATSIHQCYAFSRRVGSDSDSRSVTEVPLATC